MTGDPTTVVNGDLTWFFLLYLATSVGLTGWLAVVLNRNGEVFLRDVFHDDPEVGEAVNRLLTIGFFMLQLGYAFLILRADSIPPDEDPFALLANRLGLLLLSLAILHFVNMGVFAKIRHRVQLKDLPPPVAPQVVVPPTDPAPYDPAYDQATYDQAAYDQATYDPAPYEPAAPYDPWAPADR